MAITRRSWARARVLPLVAAATMAAAVTLATEPAGAASRALQTGIAGLGGQEAAAFANARTAGAELAHTVVRWGDIAPSARPVDWRPEDPADPHYDWTDADATIEHVVASGLTPVLLLDGAPRWAQRCSAPRAVRGEVLSGRLCDPDPRLFAEFARAAARRFSGNFRGLPRVRFWQALNEPNLSLFLNPQFKRGRPVSPHLYRALINAFYFAVKSVHRSNLVMAAGLGPIAVPRLTVGPMRFARELLCMRGRHNPRPTPRGCRGGVRFDIFDIHPYTTGGPNHKGKIDDVQLGDLAKLQELIAAADRAGRIKGRFKRTPLWITEFSWDSKPPDPGGVPVRILKRWTAEALYRAWRAGITRFFWFSLRDFARNPGLPFSETLESGLYFRGETVAEDRPKPHMYAFRFPFVAYARPSGFYFWGRTPNSRGGRVLIQIRQGGGWRDAAVARADRHGIFEGVVRGDYGRKKRGTVRAIYRPERTVPFSLKPVRDFWQPPFGKPVAED